MRPSPFLLTMRARLTLWNVMVLALALVTFGGVLRAAMMHNLMASVDRELVRRTLHHKDWWANMPFASHAPRPSWPIPWAPGKAPRRPPGSRWPVQTFASAESGAQTPAAQFRLSVIERVFDVNGKQSNPPFEDQRPWDLAAFAAAAHGRETFSNVVAGGETIRVLSATLRRKSGKIAGVVQVGYSLLDVERSLGNLNSVLLTLTPVALLVAGLGGLFLTGRMLRPLRQVNHAVETITAEDMSRRLQVSGKDEFSTLAANFNAMLSRLERAFAQQRRFTADASHELRTPLSIVKANSSLALSDPGLTANQKKAWGATERAANLMTAIVQDLLLLARSDAGQLTVELRPTYLRESVESAIDIVHTDGGARITNEVPEDLLVKGDASHLTRLFTNLLKNSLRHTCPDGKITVTAEATDDRIIAAVTDTGTGIAPEHLPHVLERFYRVDEARSRCGGGTGLGLAICESIVTAHGGKLEIASSVGVGTTVSVSLLPARTTAANPAQPTAARATQRSGCDAS